MCFYRFFSIYVTGPVIPTYLLLLFYSVMWYLYQNTRNRMIPIFSPCQNWKICNINIFLNHLRCTVRLNMFQKDKMALIGITKIQDRYQITLIQLDCRLLYSWTPQEGVYQSFILLGMVRHAQPHPKFLTLFIGVFWLSEGCSETKDSSDFKICFSSNGQAHSFF